jgi:hypothetical protein
MKSKFGVAVVIGLLATALFATVAAAQCTGMIKFDPDAFAYETDYTPATFTSAPGSQLTVVGLVSAFCSPFLDLNPADPTTEYTFIWDGLISVGTTYKAVGIGLTGMQYTSRYVGGAFRIYAGSPRNAPTAATLPALPSPGVVPDAFVDGTVILSGEILDTLSVIVTRNTLGTYSGSFRANYRCTGGTLYDRVGDATNLMSGLWCPATPPTPPGLAMREALAGGQCDLPVGWSAHPNGKWDTPSTVPTLPSTWGKIKSLYR